MLFYFIKRISLIAILSILSTFAATGIAKFKEIHNTTALEKALTDFEHIKGYVNFRQCSPAKGSKPLPVHVGKVFINFSEHVFTIAKHAEKNANHLQIDNSFNMIVGEDSRHPKHKCSPGEKCAHDVKPSHIKPAREAISGVRSFSFNRNEHTTLVSIMLYSLDGRHLRDAFELKCPWNAYDIVYKSKK